MDKPVMRCLKRNIPRNRIPNARVLEAGSLNVNGSIRSHIESLNPASYTGVDIFEHPSVDKLCDVHELVNVFMPNSFDIVVSTEMLEHINDWRRAVYNLKTVLRPGGLIIISTRRPGFPQHDFPNDYWRYSKRNMKKIFNDFNILYCTRVAGKGIVLIANKPTKWQNARLDNIFLKPRPSKSFESMSWLQKKLWITINYRVLRNEHATR